MNAIPNRSLGERVHDALVEAAHAKNHALMLRKQAERFMDAAFLMADGKNADERKAKARTHKSYEDADRDALVAEQKANIAKAEADGLQVRFEEWRTAQATARAEMTLR